MSAIFLCRNFPIIGTLFGKKDVAKSLVNFSTIISGSLANRLSLFMNRTVPSQNEIMYRAMTKVKKKKDEKVKFVIDENLISNHFDMDKLQNDIEGPLLFFKREIIERASIRSAGAVEQIKVNYEGKSYTVQDLAQVGKKGGKQIILDMSAFIDAIPSVTEALRKSALGLNPYQQGSTLIIELPRVSREQRENMYKAAKAMFMKCKIDIRNVQFKYINETESIKNVSIDEINQLKSNLVKVGDKYINEAAEILKMKENELLSNQ